MGREQEEFEQAGKMSSCLVLNPLRGKLGLAGHGASKSFTGSSLSARSILFSLALLIGINLQGAGSHTNHAQHSHQNQNQMLAPTSMLPGSTGREAKSVSSLRWGLATGENDAENDNDDLSFIINIDIISVMNNDDGEWRGPNNL